MFLWKCLDVSWKGSENLTEKSSLKIAVLKLILLNVIINAVRLVGSFFPIHRHISTLPNSPHIQVATKHWAEFPVLYSSLCWWCILNIAVGTWPPQTPSLSLPSSFPLATISLSFSVIYMYMYAHDWVPLPSPWNCHNVVNWLCCAVFSHSVMSNSL